MRALTVAALCAALACSQPPKSCGHVVVYLDLDRLGEMTGEQMQAPLKTFDGGLALYREVCE